MAVSFNNRNNTKLPMNNSTSYTKNGETINRNIHYPSPKQSTINKILIYAAMMPAKKKQILT